MDEIGSEWSEVPRFVPVRMLNEFNYCERLFHLEWVSQLFQENDYTIDGQWQHRAVDEARGAAPDPNDPEQQFREATSLMLSSESLGLVGKADVVQGDGERVIPVDVKRGSPAPTPERVWLPEQIQVCALGLLLRDNGYTCDEGAIFFVETRERVAIPFTDELVSATLQSLERLRDVAADPIAPPPLDNDRKCDGCSLIGICLPDETRYSNRQRIEPPRRLIASDSPAMPLYVTIPGASVGKSGDRVIVSRRKEQLSSTRVIDVSQLCLFGNVSVSSQLVRELMSREVPICWYSSGGWFSGIAEGLPGKNVQLRIEQVRVSTGDVAVGIARAMIEGKIRNSRTLLRRNTTQRNNDTLESLRRLGIRASQAESLPTLLGYEGTAARLYFGQFPTMLRHPEAFPGGAFEFAGRNRRPPRDAVNAMLSFAYALLVKDCVATLRSIGFDPYLGVLHQPRFGRPALALDLAEEFRPLIAESVVLTVINNGEIKPAGFTVRAGGVAMNADARRTFLQAFERRMAHELTHPVFGYPVTYRRAIELQARLLAGVMLGEIDRYQALTTR